MLFRLLTVLLKIHFRFFFSKASIFTKAKSCCSACNANSACKAWVIDVICFLKSAVQRIYKPGNIAGIKCSGGTGTLPPMILT